MPSNAPAAGHFAEEIVVEKGQRYSADTGNPITVAPQSYDPNAICYYNSDNQPIRYADVYPGPVNVHQNTALTDFAVAFEIDSGIFLSPTIAPVCTVAHRTNIYYKVANQGADVVRTPTDESDLKAIGANANEVQQGFDTDTYSCVLRGYRDFLPDRVATNADEVLQLQQRITTFLESKLLYRWDARVLAALSTSNFNNATYTTAGGGKPAAATQALPYNNLAFAYASNKLRLQNLMTPGTHVVLPSVNAQSIAASPELKAQIVYDVAGQAIKQGGMSPMQRRSYGLPSVLFDFQPVVAPHITNTAKKGQTASFSDVMADSAAFITVEAPGRMTKNTITTFRFGGIVVKSYRDEGREGMFIEVLLDQVEKITNSNGGYVLTTLQ